MLPTAHTNEGDQAPPPIRPRRSRSWLFVGASSLIALAVIVYVTPWVIANTNLRNSLLARLLPPEKISVRSEQATLSWTQPLDVEGLQIKLPQQDAEVDIEKVILQRPWWQVLRESPHFGSVRLIQPVIDVGVEELLKPAAVRTDRHVPPFTLQASVEGALLRLRAAGLKHPVLAFDGIDAQVEVTEVDGHSVVQVGRTQFLDHFALTPELCNRGLQLVAPIVAEVSRVEGSASLEFDSLKVPLCGSDRLTDVRGTLRLHNVTTGLSNPVLQSAISNLASLFDFKMPETVRIAEDAVVHFTVKNDRVVHDSVHFKLPAVTGDRLWRSSGSVGFDESLDLEIEAPVPVDAVSDGALARLLSAKPLRLHVGGTISKPELELPEDASFLNQLGDVLVGTDEENSVEKILTRAEAALETGRAVRPLWDWAFNWLRTKE